MTQMIFSCCHSERSEESQFASPVAPIAESQRCFDFAQHDRIAFESANRRVGRAKRLQQTALLKIAEIATRRALHEINRELE